MMEDSQKLLRTLQEVCRQQHNEIEQKKIQIWDQEEENRVLRKRVEKLQNANGRLEDRVKELESWCGHLQGCIDEEEKIRLYHQDKIQELEKWTTHLQECIEEEEREKEYHKKRICELEECTAKSTSLVKRILQKLICAVEK